MVYRPGAGFIIYRKFKNGIKFLGLKGPNKIRKTKNGIWDFPKGIKEPGESDWSCAQRETFEEASIFIIESDIRAGPYKSSSCVIYLVEVDCDPIISPNPVSGIYEHEGWDWLSPEEIEINCYDWLQPFVIWARGVLKI